MKRQQFVDNSCAFTDGCCHLACHTTYPLNPPETGWDTDGDNADREKVLYLKTERMRGALVRKRGDRVEVDSGGLASRWTTWDRCSREEGANRALTLRSKPPRCLSYKLLWPAEHSHLSLDSSIHQSQSSNLAERVKHTHTSMHVYKTLNPSSPEYNHILHCYSTHTHRFKGRFKSLNFYTCSSTIHTQTFTHTHSHADWWIMHMLHFRYCSYPCISHTQTHTHRPPTQSSSVVPFSHHQ